MNEKLEKLNQEIEKTEKKLRRAQHEEKILEYQIKTLTRKERTHRLCTRAAMLESYLPHPEAITDEPVSLFLKLLFRQDSTRQMVRSLKGWLSGLKEKKAALLEQTKEPTIPELLSRYLDMRSGERTGWTSKGKLKGTVGDFNKVMEALDFLRRKEISTVESLDAYLDKVSGEILSVKTDIRNLERRIKAIDTTLSHLANHGAYKEVYKKYASIGWKTRKEKFAAEHREELDAYLAAKRFFKAHQEELPFDTKELKKEREQLSGELSEKNEGLQAVQEDMKLLRDVRYWINHVLPPDQRRVVPEPGKKPSINEQLSWKIEGTKQREEQKRQQPRRQQKQDMEL